jgi:type IV secretion system protein VirB8
MDDVNLSISQYVKSGKYYNDARLWYVNKFIFPITERSYAMILLSCFTLGLTILVLFYLQVDPSPREITYISPAKDMSKYYSVILPAGAQTEAPQLRVTKYMLATYIIRRESYEFGYIKDQLAYIQNTTVGSEYLKYENAVSINNPFSPIMSYQDVNTRQIKVKQVKMLKSSPGVGRAMVYFTATVRNIASNKVISENFVATVSFKIDNIKMLIDQNSKKLGFLVLDYTIS